MLMVDQDGGWCVALDHQPSAQFGERGLTCGRLAQPRTCRDPHAVGAAYGETDLARTASPDMTIEPVRLRNDRKSRIQVSKRLCIAEKQGAALAQREMKDGHDLRLCRRA